MLPWTSEKVTVPGHPVVGSGRNCTCSGRMPIRTSRANSSLIAPSSGKLRFPIWMADPSFSKIPDTMFIAGLLKNDPTKVLIGWS